MQLEICRNSGLVAAWYSIAPLYKPGDVVLYDTLCLFRVEGVLLRTGGGWRLRAQNDAGTYYLMQVRDDGECEAEDAVVNSRHGDHLGVHKPGDLGAVGIANGEFAVLVRTS